MPPKHYRDVYLREEIYRQLLQLKAVMGKRSVNDVVEELLKYFTVNTVSSPVNTVKLTVNTGKVNVNTVKPNVNTGDSPVSTVSSNVNTVKQGEDTNSNELVKRFESLEKSIVELREVVSVLEKGFKVFTRKQQDELNAYTSKVEQILQKQGELVEKLEVLEERVKKLEGDVTQEKEVRRGRWDKCEILRKELIIFESSIAHKIKNRDSFFASLERDCGAEVIEAKDQRVAVDPNFWNEFKEKLNTLNTNNESVIKKALGAKGHTLLKTLWEGGIVYYDSVNKKWVLSEPEESKEEEELEDIDYV